MAAPVMRYEGAPRGQWSSERDPLCWIKGPPQQGQDTGTIPETKAEIIACFQILQRMAVEVGDIYQKETLTVPQMLRLSKDTLRSQYTELTHHLRIGKDPSGYPLAGQWRILEEPTADTKEQLAVTLIMHRSYVCEEFRIYAAREGFLNTLLASNTKATLRAKLEDHWQEQLRVADAEQLLMRSARKYDLWMPGEEPTPEPRQLGNYPTLHQLQMMVTEMKFQHEALDKKGGLKEQVADFPLPEPPKDRTTKMQEILETAGDGRKMKGREADPHSRNKAPGAAGKDEWEEVEDTTTCKRRATASSNSNPSISSAQGLAPMPKEKAVSFAWQ